MREPLEPADPFGPSGPSGTREEREPRRAPEPSWVRPLLWVGAAVYPLLALLLWQVTSLGIWDALFLAFLLELLPVLSVVQVPMTEVLVARGGALERIPVYVTSAGVILLLGWVAFLLGRGDGGVELLGLVWLPSGPTLLWAGGLTVAALVLLALFAGLGRILDRQESPVLRALIPRSPAEKASFVGLSMAAGLGEELAYRSWAIPALVAVMGSPWGAAALSSVVFGFVHAYQGILGVSRAALLGFVLAASLLVTGSVIPAILAHAAIDVIAGLFLGDRLLDTRR